MPRKKPPQRARVASLKHLPRALKLRLLGPAVVLLLMGGAGLSASLVHVHHAGTAAAPVHKTTVHKPAAKHKAPAPVAPKQAVAPTPAAPPPAAPKPAPAPVQTPAPSLASVSASPGSSVSSLTPAPAPSPAPSSTTSGTGTSAPSGGSSAPTVSYSSYNWAGYVATAGNYTGVSGSWVVPNPTGPSGTTSADAAWIGIGGVSSNDLIQVGTDDLVATDGTVSTTVFYELLPDAPVYPASITVSPGDSITAAIRETSPGQWSITISDTTNDGSYTTSVAYTSSHSSAEWIEEDPSYANGGLVPFDSFGSVPFRAGSVTTNGSAVSLAAAAAAQITLVDNQGRALAVPSALGSDGASFTVTRQ